MSTGARSSEVLFKTGLTVYSKMIIYFQDTLRWMKYLIFCFLKFENSIMTFHLLSVNAKFVLLKEKLGFIVIVLISDCTYRLTFWNQILIKIFRLLKFFLNYYFLFFRLEDARLFFELAGQTSEGELTYEIGQLMKRLWNDRGVQVSRIIIITYKI